MGCYKQAGVGVAQAVEVNRREIVGFQKFGKPCCDRAGVYGLAVPFGKKQVIVYRLAVNLDFACPFCADLQAFPVLVSLVVLQKLDAVRPDAHAPPGAFCLWRVEYRTHAGDRL